MDLNVVSPKLGTLNTKKSTIMMSLKSNKKSLIEIGNFYSSIKEQYEKITSDKSGKLFIYNGAKSLPKFGSYQLDKSQSFDNIFFKNKDRIITDILNMKDKDHYKKYGMKNKTAHLYVGPRGSGKTCCITALATLTNRSVCYIPISRIQRNEELETIIYGGDFNGVKYEMDEIIFVFDELDSFDSLNSSNMLKKTIKFPQNKKKSTAKTESESEETSNNSSNNSSNDFSFDKLNIGMVLNLLDGNIDQDGMIIIGTANSCEKLDSAIYRNGRMELINFEYMGRTEISNMIEYYYGVKLSDEQILKIRDDKTVQSLNLKNACLKHIQKKNQNKVDINNLIDEINYMFDHVEEINEKIEKKLPTPLVQTFPKENNYDKVFDPKKFITYMKTQKNINLEIDDNKSNKSNNSDNDDDIVDDNLFKNYVSDIGLDISPVINSDIDYDNDSDIDYDNGSDIWPYNVNNFSK